MLAHSLPQAPTTFAEARPMLGPKAAQAAEAPPATPPTGPEALYRRLRQQLLGEVLRHRASAQAPGLAGDAHRMHRRTCQRQLGALRQAYRRTQEALAWQAYVQAPRRRP